MGTSPVGGQTIPFENTSGAPGATLPEELKGLNWGAFFLGWIWAIGNKTMVGFLLCFFLSGIGNIICLFTGNEWAWQNRRFASIEEFKAVQKAWTIWGFVIFLISVFLGILFMGAILAIVVPAIMRQKSL